MNLSSPFIRRPVMTTIVMAAILLLGFLSFKKLPVTDMPNVDYPMIMVTASYSGASPEVMARTVTTPIEKELLNINGIKHIASQTNRGYTWITLLFDFGVDINEASQDVQRALKKAEHVLPSDMEDRPTYQKANAHQESIIYLVLTSSTSSLADLYDIAHTRIEPKVARIQGVGKVQVHGSPYAVRIQLNPELMAARGIGFDEVRRSIFLATGSSPLGVLETPGRKFTLEIPGQYKNAADFSHLPLNDKVRLKDVAIVADGLESDEVFHYLTRDQNNLAICLGIQKQSGANAVKISEDLKKMLPEIQNELPPSMHLNLWFDKANWIKEAIEDVEWSLVLAFALVVGVIYVSLGRVRETLVAATALPLSIIGTFIIMHFLHYNIDILSLLALTLAMGFVIDDAIVVLENIVRHKEMGYSPKEAALAGSKQISFTILSMTLSLVAVFLPLLFMQDVTGMLFREFSVTLAVSIIVSGFISLTLTPMLCSKFLKSHAKDAPVKQRRFLKFYEITLNWCLTHKKTTLLGALGCTALAVLLFRFLPINLFPEEDRAFVWSFVQMPSGLSKKDTEAHADKLNHIVQNHSAVESFLTLNYKDYHIYLISLLGKDKRAPQAEIVKDLQTKFGDIPGTQAFMRGVQLISANMGGYARNKYQFVLRGADVEEVRNSAEKLKEKLSSYPGIVNPESSLKADDPKLEISIFEEKAKDLGLSRKNIQTLLQNAYAGGTVGRIEKGSEQYKVILELGSEFQKNSAALAKLSLKAPNGELIPLKALATWKEAVGLQTIEHVDGLSSAMIYFDIAKDTSVPEAFKALKQIAANTLPSSVSGKLEGTAEMESGAASDTLLLLILAVVAMYVVLGILYESFIHPFTILSSLPFACLGGILTLLIFRESLSLYSMVGFLLLIGIVKKNGIMMVDYAIEMQREEGKPAFQAIQEACLVRFRPIMMTTVAAVMGALPVAIGIGAGSETRRGLGLVIAGGLVFSQLLTLYITPIVYLYLEKLKKRTEQISHVENISDPKIS